MRLHIIGGCGSGKTTLARQLAAQLVIPHYDLDELNWDNSAQQHNTKADPAKRDARLAEICQHENWVIEGVYHKWCALSFSAADTIIILEPPLWVMQLRVLRRFMQKLITAPRSMRRGELKALWSLLHWNAAYRTRDLPQAKALITSLGRAFTVCKTNADIAVIQADLSSGCSHIRH